MLRFVRQLWRRHRLTAAMLVAFMVMMPALGSAACATEAPNSRSGPVECVSNCGSHETPKAFDTCLCSVCHGGHHSAANLPDLAVTATVRVIAISPAWFNQTAASPAAVRGLERPPRV
jgi:hypothetical protein